MDFSKTKLAIIVIAIFSFILVNKTQAQTVEHIQNFVSNIIIQTDGTLLVDEKITYDFGGNQKHGIFRNIPITSKDGPELVIQQISVSDENGVSYKHTDSTSNKILNIKIGDSNQLVSGVKVYDLRYTVYNSIRTFTDHDELYLNATGNKWPVGISNASAIIKTPASSTSTLNTICYTGVEGSKEQACTAAYGGAVASFSTTRALGPGEGLTVAVSVPKGFISNVVHPVSNWLSPDVFAIIIAVLVSILIIVITAVFVVRTAGGPKPVIPKQLKGLPIITEYSPPEDITPIDAGTLFDRRVDMQDISSVIIDLAIKGYLKINYTTEVIKFWPDKKDFELVKLKDGSELNHPAYKIMYDFLFQNRDSVKLSEIKGSGLNLDKNIAIQTKMQRIKKDTESYLFDQQLFDKKLSERSKKFGVAVTVIGGICYILARINIIESLSAISFVILIFVLLVSHLLLFGDKLTTLGVDKLKSLLGFREFLQMTEADKLRLTNAPDLKPEMFEKFLPYAMVLGVETKWAKQFEGLYNQNPAWYSDPSGVAFSSTVLTHNLNLFNSSFNQSFSAGSRSSSGFGGGGFSGGGSGGGGGGSW